MDAQTPITDLPAPVESVFRVSVDNVNLIWPQLEPLLALPLALRPTHNAEDVYKMLLAQMVQLWVQMDGPTLEAFVITEFEVCPRGIWLRAWLAGADREASFDNWRMEEAITAWARINNCRGISAGGRLGWMKRFPGAKYEGALMRVTWE
jgi:hypothetical protein